MENQTTVEPQEKPKNEQENIISIFVYNDSKHKASISYEN